MQSHARWFKFAQGMVLTIVVTVFFMTQLSIGGCSRVNDATQTVEQASIEQASIEQKSIETQSLKESRTAKLLTDDKPESSYS